VTPATHRGPRAPSRTRVVAAACTLLLGACAFGMHYGGDEAGLERKSYPVPWDEGRAVSYLEIGEPDLPRVIFVHGSPGAAASYVHYLHDPIPGHEAVAVDRLGYGGSRTGGPVTSFEQQAAALAPLLVERDGRWPIVVGHSLGGPIACRLAADNPGRVAGLVIAGGALDPDLEDIRWYNRVLGIPVLNLAVADHLLVSNAEILATEGELRELAPLLGRIECPIVIVHGTRDSLVHFDNVDYMLRNFTASQSVKLVTLYGEDHFLTKEREEEIREAVLELHGMLGQDGELRLP